ncbi:MAG TPA: hypothetical protein VMR25_14615 [Planctomycetaceae bacterium]|nr:hypothetical protein [Planctomycetaceae bacterium]
MGLDMYLKANVYLRGWNHSPAAEQANYAKAIKLAGFKMEDACAESPSVYIEITVGYWRKANAIHRWFVQNVQEGRDDCGDYYVTDEKLDALLADCEAVIASPENAKDILPTGAGFFFGSTKIDEYYMGDLVRTVAIIKKVRAKFDQKRLSIYYNSSW